MKKTLYVILLLLISLITGVSVVNAAETGSFASSLSFDMVPAVTSANPGPNIYRTPQTVTLSTDKPATIYYTIDGSEPTISSPIYKGNPIYVDRNMTIQAFSVNSSGIVEDKQYFTYIIDPTAPDVIPLVIGINDQVDPVIWQDKLVYKSNETGNYEVFMKNLLTGATTQITNSGIDTNAIDYQGGNLIVWESNNQIYAYNLTDGKTKQVTNDSMIWFNRPRVSGDNIVFPGMTQDTLDADIYIFNYTTNALTRLSQQGYQGKPEIYGSKIVWKDDRSGNWELYTYDLTTNQESKIVDNTSGDKWIFQWDIFGNSVSYYVFDAFGNSEIHIMDLTNFTDRLLVNNLNVNNLDVTYINFQGNRIVWVSNSEIYVYDLTTETVKQITANRLAKDSPRVYGDTIVWAEAYGDLDIYMAKVSFTQPDTTPPTVTASPAGGTYNSTQTVTLTTDEPADIYYTVDGSDPTTASALYTGPITINSTTTLKFMAVDLAGNNSTISTINYTIQYATQLAYTGFLSATKDATVTLSAYLAAANGGPSDLSGREIIFTLGSQTVSAFTDAAGNATAALTLNQAAGNYPLTAVYNGDAALLGSTYTGTFYITNGNSNNVKPNVSMDPVVITPDANGQTYTAAITGTVDQGAAVEVSVSINHGTPVVYQAVVNGTTWAYTIANLAKNDQVRIEAIAKDAVGNTSLPTKDNFKVR